MLGILKLAAAGIIGLAMINPLNSPKADNCECKAKADTQSGVPHADNCECKAKAN